MVGEFRNEDKIVNSLFLQFFFLPTKEKIENHFLFSLPINMPGHNRQMEE